MSSQSPIRWSRHQKNVPRLGKSASMESLPQKPEDQWEAVEAMGSESPFVVVNPIFKSKYDTEGAEDAGPLELSPMAGGDASYDEITHMDEWQSRTEENGTAQKGCLQPKGYLKTKAYMTGVHTFDTHTPEFFRRAAPVIPAPVVWSAPRTTALNSVPNNAARTLPKVRSRTLWKEEEDKLKMQKQSTDDPPGTTAKRQTKEEERRRREERRRSEEVAGLEPVTPPAGTKRCKRRERRFDPFDFDE